MTTPRVEPRGETLALIAGRELDLEVWARVFGNERICLHLDTTVLRGSLVRCRSCGEEFGSTTLAMARGTIPRYSTDIAEAWKVVDMMAAPGFWVNINADGAGQYTVEWMTHDEKDEPYWLAEVADVDSAPLAICLAALREMQ